MLSKEDQALIQYMKDSGIPHRVTSTTNHSLMTNAGNPSRHVAQGTGGIGLAIDVAGPTPSRDSQSLADIFVAFSLEERKLHELIYAGPQVTYNIKNETRVPKYATKDHHDHVHVSVDKGVFLLWPKKEAVMGLNQPAVAIEDTPTSNGYWIFAEDGGVFTYGGAEFFGSGAADADGPDIIPGDRVISASITVSGKGYRLLTEDGFIYNYGDAVYHGGPND
jgi:hypothetical protein